MDHTLPRQLTVAAVWLGLSLGVEGAPGQEAPAAPPSKSFAIERFEWQAEPALSKAVRRLIVRNDYGDIRARFAGDGVVMVTATLQRLGSAPDIGVNVERHGDALVVSVVSPPGRRAVSVERPGKTEVDRADVVVYVPENAALEATSLRGIVEARRLKGRVDARTLDGEIRAESEAAVRALSGSGDITVSVGVAADAASLIETGSGNVWLSLQEGANHVLQVETSGRVTSAVALEEETAAAARPGGRRRMTTPGGHHGVPVIVRSESGAVEIVQRRK
jgi:hypothetical protein